MIVRPRWIGMSLFLAGITTLAIRPDARDAGGKAIDTTVDANRAARASQQRIDKLDDQTRAMLECFVERGPDGLLDEPRPGAPGQIGEDLAEAVIAKMLRGKPVDATHRSTRSMASARDVSRTAVVRTRKAVGLQPHRRETFKLSTDPPLVDKVCDIIGLYLDAQHRAVVLCGDEKSQIQAFDRRRLILPMAPGLPERRTHDYQRHGATTLVSSVGHRHRSRVWATASSSPLDRGPEVLIAPGRDRAHRRRRARGHGQRRHPQDAGGEAMVCPAPAIPFALHADLIVVDQPGRARVRGDQLPADPPWHPPQYPGTRASHPHLARRLQPEPQAFRVDQVRRPDPQFRQTILFAYFYLTTIAQRAVVADSSAPDCRHSQSTRPAACSPGSEDCHGGRAPRSRR